MSQNSENKAIIRLIQGDEEFEISTTQQLLEVLPFLRTTEKYARAYAGLVNHLEKGYQYSVIMEPEEFKSAYMEKYNAEPVEAVDPGVMRLRNFALPDFTLITPPEVQDGTLTFYAKSAYRGTAFVVKYDGESDPVYRPIKSSSAE